MIVDVVLLDVNYDSIFYIHNLCARIIQMTKLLICIFKDR